MFENGVEESFRPEPLSSISILTFHDSVELFMQLASEYKDVGKSGIKFLEYWNKLPYLSQKESMRRMNNARKSLKHYGTLPSNQDIEAFRVNTTDFFEYNSMKIFGIEFSSISLIDLIILEEPKKYLSLAQNHFANSEFEESINNSAIAFEFLISGINELGYDFSKLFYEDTFSWVSAFDIGLQSHRHSTEPFNYRKMEEFVDKTIESIKMLQKTNKLLLLNINIKDYIEFKKLTPIIGISGTKKVFINKIAWVNDSPGKNEAQLCFQFVIKTAINIQELFYNDKT